MICGLWKKASHSGWERGGSINYDITFFLELNVKTMQNIH